MIYAGRVPARAQAGSKALRLVAIEHPPASLLFRLEEISLSNLHHNARFYRAENDIRDLSDLCALFAPH